MRAGERDGCSHPSIDSIGADALREGASGAFTSVEEGGAGLKSGEVAVLLSSKSGEVERSEGKRKSGSKLLIHVLSLAPCVKGGPSPRWERMADVGQRQGREGVHEEPPYRPPSPPPFPRGGLGSLSPQPALEGVSGCIPPSTRSSGGRDPGRAELTTRL